MSFFFAFSYLAGSNQLNKVMGFVVFLMVIVVLLAIIFGLKESPKKYNPNKGDDISINQSAHDSFPEYEEVFKIEGAFVPERKGYIWDYVKIKDEVILFHDKENQFSNRAIGVSHEGTLIGYISKYDIEIAEDLMKENQIYYIYELFVDLDWVDVHIVAI